ncbi:MAG: UDP-N-acetylglucosamine 1-carboxyvinyltransferase [Verrucomicrobiota bacterium]|jgi:UDP-N-acetylglucosamine 1-carboxyvinyltransferase|nr:UDP-N-acetylglucosamine 1-carboxyvinyltransferase [Verrucomicrobiota bacterium]MEC9112380.1 UDP-N-acetylglucosamine 1-carboxyvinyltransferase [Verrucomicrobiota bacterium]MED5260570.1 UDP-N-acetylglucosamine 1-carboxyvinyltransferase [Verrucomicrobiota bacterium]|tara:strand:- start:207 stop:1469 length:1263 start_codon:yes stop_codon:yes gene_type:complete
MEKLYVDGGSRLSGNIRISGSKNSSLPILAATLLTDSECILRNVPDLSDTNYMVQILSTLGAEVERASGNVIVKANKVAAEAPYDLVRKMRASVCVLGPMLARNGEALVSLPGGCVIGDRPIDLHLRGLEALGAEVEVKGGDIKVTAPSGLKGANVNMSGQYGSTVLGTDNVMMAAVFAEGETIIEGAAAEPEVEDLAKFLNSLGAKIEGAGTSRIVIHGVEDLSGGEHVVIPDRIEAGTFMVAGALIGDGITLENVRAKHLKKLIKTLKGCDHKVKKLDGNKIYVKASSDPKANEITTEPYPGFPTDMQAQMCALFSVTPGISVVKETIFPSRFMHVPELKRMGANISLNDSTAVIRGVDQLSAAPVMASDLRASAALVLAGLAAEGTTEINRLYHIDRGYEYIDRKLEAIGAKLRRGS